MLAEFFLRYNNIYSPPHKEVFSYFIAKITNALNLAISSKHQSVLVSCQNPIKVPGVFYSQWNL